MTRAWQWLKKQVQPTKARTVRYLFTTALGAALFFGASALLSDQASYVYLESSNRTVQVGDRVSVQVLATTHVPVNAVSTTLRYDDEAMSIQEIDRGQSVITIWTTEPQAADGSVKFGGGTYRRGFVGAHQLLSIDFVAKSAGAHTFTISQTQLLAGDGEGTVVPTATTDNTSIKVFAYDENTPLHELQVDEFSATDLDQDGRVSLRDVSSFLAAWGRQDRLYDFNNDGRMNFTDFSILLADAVLE